MPPEIATAIAPPRARAQTQDRRRGYLLSDQRLILKSIKSHFLTLCAGRAGAGKSAGGIIGLLDESIMNPGELYLIAGRTRGAVVNNLLPDLRKALRGLEWPYEYNATLGLLTLENGARFEFVGAHTKEALEKIQGRNAAGAMLDEFALLTQSYVEMAITRVRRGSHPCIIATFNKTMPMHWAKQKYWDVADERGYGKISISRKVPYIDMSGAESSLVGAARARLIDNEWAGNAGLCFPNYMICDPLEREDIKVLEVAADFGMSNPTAALYIANHDTVIGEYYGPNPTDEPRRVSEHADAIMDGAAAVADIPVWRAIIDPSAVALRAELRRFTAVRNADNSVVEGIQTTQSWLDSGRIRIVRGAAPELEREMATYAWDEGAQDRGVDKPVKADDHACDALRYYCYTSKKLGVSGLSNSGDGALAGAGADAAAAPVRLEGFQWGAPAPAIGGRS